MKVGDLVRYRHRIAAGMLKTIAKNDIGIILEIQLIKERDFRSDDSILVMWYIGREWIWRRELEKVNESR